MHMHIYLHVQDIHKYLQTVTNILEREGERERERDLKGDRV